MYDSKSTLQELMKLSPDEIGYEQLKRIERSKGSVCVDIEDDLWEKNRNEIVIDDLLYIFQKRNLVMCYKSDNFCFWNVLRTI